MAEILILNPSRILILINIYSECECMCVHGCHMSVAVTEQLSGVGS